MKFYSTGEAAKEIGVTRDSLFAALKNGAPDTANRIGGRRYFTEEEVKNLAAWYSRRRAVRNGFVQIEGGEGANDCLA